MIIVTFEMVSAEDKTMKVRCVNKYTGEDDSKVLPYDGDFAEYVLQSVNDAMQSPKYSFGKKLELWVGDHSAIFKVEELKEDESFKGLVIHDVK